MAPLPDEPRANEATLSGNKVADRNMSTIVAIAAAFLLIAFAIDVPGQAGLVSVSLSPPISP